MNGIASLQDIVEIEKKSIMSGGSGGGSDSSAIAADLPGSTYDMIRQGAALNPEAPALSFFLQADAYKQAETWSYRQLLQQITRTANFFHGLGASKDSVIAFILPNLPETHFVIWGGQAAGIVLAVNPLLEADVMLELLNTVRVSILVTLAPFPGTDLWQKVSSIAADIPSLQHMVLVNLASHVQGLKKIPAHLLQKKQVFDQYGLHGLKKALPPNIQLHDFQRSIRTYAADALNSRRNISPHDYSSFFCTGGTTGLPKIAMRTHRNETSNAWSAGQFLGDGVNPDKRIFCGLPLFHVNAVLVTGLLPFSKGAHVILATPQGYRGEGVVKNFWKLVSHYRINFFSAVPTLYSYLLQVPLNGENIASLEYGLCGAAPLQLEVIRSFQEKTGLKMLEGYGLTEGTCVSSVNPPLGGSKPGSIGLRVPGQLMKAVILDERGNYERDAAYHEIGVITISGPNVFAGYTLPEQNKGIWLDLADGQRWLNTGDLGYQDEQGYFFLTGRKKELIIRGGHNIDPSSIEEPMLKHPAVELAAAIGRPDRDAGELPVLYVQLKPGAQATTDELLSFAKANIGERAAIPKKVEIIEQMPLTAVGKIYKVALKHREITAELSTALQAVGIHSQSLQLYDDKRKGLVIQLKVDASETEVAALAVLQNYAFHVDISVC